MHEPLHQHHLSSNTGQSLGVWCMYNDPIAYLFSIYSWVFIEHLLYIIACC